MRKRNNGSKHTRELPCGQIWLAICILITLPLTERLLSTRVFAEAEKSKKWKWEPPVWLGRCPEDIEDIPADLDGFRLVHQTTRF